MLIEEMSQKPKLQKSKWRCPAGTAFISQ